METKTRPFSIYLLKQGFGPENGLADNHKLEPADADDLPEGAKLFILDAQPKPPWWSEYFSIKDDIKQEFKGALVFIPVDGRCFAISFGSVLHHLRDTAYEYDFGLRVTLNSLDPKELKSADMIDPGNARRKRTQVPASTELTYLDFDGNSEIIKSLTGKVKKEYQKLFKNATGSAALKVSLKISPDELPKICANLLELYDKEDYKTSFPNIQNIAPVKDPTKIDELDQHLLAAFREKSDGVLLSIPDIIDYRDNTCCLFNGDERASDVYPDITIEALYDFLGEGFDYKALTIEDLKAYRMLLTDAEGRPDKSYSIYRSLIMDTAIDKDDAVYHLCDGSWYRVEKSFIERIKKYLDDRCEASELCAYNHDDEKNGIKVYSEEKYNAGVPIWNKSYICLDQTNISPPGHTQIEPCDIFTAKKDDGASCGVRAWLYYIKISTRSSHLSHLFNQGVNSVELISEEEQFRANFLQLIKDRLAGNDEETYLKPVHSRDLKVVFAIVTHKNAAGKSDNLPLFSKISLMRSMQRLSLYRVQSALTYIRDESPKKHAHPKYHDLNVEIRLNDAGKREVFPIDGQGVDVNLPVKGCCKAVKEAVVGSRFKISVRKSDEGEIRSFHSWPFEAIA